jgi:prepilin-type N-terminal cleavage/methylation domain-containing protein
MPNIKLQKGFTLIELMVVITIIGVVFGIVISSANQIKKSTRDAQRKSDIAKIQQYLQSYYTDQGYFPQNGQVTPGGSISNGGVTYLFPIPSDPVSSNPNYCYLAYKNSNGIDPNCDNSDTSPANRCNYYQLYAKMETTGNRNPVSVCTAGSNYNYLLVTP